MSGKVAFLFGVHDHQPVGNFDHVIEEACHLAYEPFLIAMAGHPRVKFTIHVSGCLWEWVAAHRPTMIQLLKPLVERGQAELMSGGFYEPIFPIIPEDDLVGQIKKLNWFLDETFGVKARGGWLTERVWEPHLPALLRKGGLEWTAVDDWHLKGAGVPGTMLHGAVTTDHLGETVSILPIDERLRYLVPFKEPEETIAHLKAIADAAPAGTLPAGILLDDGEKFGVWPKTHEWVYQRGWLDRFFAALEGAGDWIEFLTCSEYLDRVRPAGPVYMGTASYSEMMEWVLPAAAQADFERGREALKAAHVEAAAAPYLKGGTWRGFHFKYPEANWLHKKMLRVSRKVKAAAAKAPDDSRVGKAREALWRGQCNCPYWHGVFGGLYLNYLRYAVWHQLIEAEKLADEVLHGVGSWIHVEETDVDADGEPEVIVETGEQVVTFKPTQGASAVSWELREPGWNVLDTLGRREEAYHARLRQAKGGGGGDVASIHDQVRVKEEGLERFLIYDRQPRRGALVDHLWAEGTTLADVVAGRAHELADATRYRTSCIVKSSQEAFACEFQGELRFGENSLKVTKANGFIGGSMLTGFVYGLGWKGSERLRALWAVEWNIGLLAGDAQDRYVLFDGKKPDDPRAASEGEAMAKVIEAVDGWQRVAIRFQFQEPVRVWRHPVWTVSQSEGGFERTYQSTALYFVCPLDLAPGEVASLSFGHDVVKLP